MIADDGHIAVVADDRSFTMIADYDFAIAAAWVNRAHDRRNPAGAACLCQRIDDSGRSAVIAENWRIAMVADDWGVAVISHDRRVAVVSDNWRSAMIANPLIVVAWRPRGLVTRRGRCRANRENGVNDSNTIKSDSRHDTTNPFWFQTLCLNRQTW